MEYAELNLNSPFKDGMLEDSLSYRYMLEFKEFKKRLHVSVP